jgi:acetyl-CoA carboxylase biotin carboxylase subunit
MTTATIIRKLLIANRGEIACRIARTCREIGIATVAIYSDADASALHVTMADEAVHIGASPAAESYLNSERIIAAAQRTGADAIHPGYGFLAENPAFAQAVIDAGLIFIGPAPQAIEAMGKKREAKQMLRDVPLVPGYNGEDQSDHTLEAAADDIGYPLMIKASAGGGGKGMRRVDSAGEFLEALDAARREAQQAFGDDTLILEKLIESPRHIEIQVFGDHYGNVIALGERECSIQRRHQKIIEEAPSTALDAELRARMCAAAVNIGQQLNYANAGTVEFMLDVTGNFYFIEMNTRLQVEHPVTEMLYREDLVRWQILIAEGRRLSEIGPYYQPHGHAIEARIYAEDPANDFLPVIGEIIRWAEPNSIASSGLRIDSGVCSGSEISVHYDPMIAKVIAWGKTRQEAIRRLDHALARLQLLGIRNNIAFLQRVITHPDHITGKISTWFLDQHPELMSDETALSPTVLIAAAIAREPDSISGKSFWRNNPNRPVRHRFAYEDAVHEVLLMPNKRASTQIIAQIGETHFQVSLESQEDENLILTVDGHRQALTALYKDDTCWLHHNGQTHRLDWITPLPQPGATSAAEGSLRAPMPGQVISIRVEAGQFVTKGAILITLEAMKMEHRLEAPYNGIVEAVHFQVGDSVQADEVLLDVSRAEEQN